RGVLLPDVVDDRRVGGGAHGPVLDGVGQLVDVGRVVPDIGGGCRGALQRARRAAGCRAAVDRRAGHQAIPSRSLRGVAADSRISTVPLEPSTRTRSPVLMRCVPSWVPTTAGMPNSRLS